MIWSWLVVVPSIFFPSFVSSFTKGNIKKENSHNLCKEFFHKIWNFVESANFRRRKLENIPIKKLKKRFLNEFKRDIIFQDAGVAQ
ncbi:hypothetical protein [Priestia megaterium]|uniref:hypothetical protein n=1 Tax=Priestia megaterium TaxID=1404 RepID=UPI0012FF4B7D|nr:hypothetical protein [Priestia megaterium]MED4215467.1 hypothetical protein [Priestia megaterium]WEZ39826.1 hypothetical protein P5636_06045 [Priestia megaterium DSM 319]